MQQIVPLLGHRTVAARPEARAGVLGLPSAAFLVGSLWLAYAWPWLSGDVVVPWDAKNHFFPMLRFLAASLHSGDSPAWAPYHFSGWPQIADPQSLIFSPVMRLVAALTPEPTLWHADLAELLALLLGGAGMVLLFREKGWSLWGGALAAVLFMSGGSAASRLQHVGQVLSYALISLALWAATCLASRPNWRSGLLFGVLSGLLVLGRDQVALLGCLLVAAHALALFWAEPDRPGAVRRLALPACIAVLTALAIAAVPVLLTHALAGISNRPDIPFEIAGRGSLPPAALLTLAIPGLFDSAGTDYWGPGSGVWADPLTWVDPAIVYLYAGLIPLALLVQEGVLRRGLLDRDIRLFSGATLAALLYALGWHTPVFRLLYDHVPGVDLFRRPADATFHLNLLLAVLAGYMLHRLLAAPGPARRSESLAALAVLLAPCLAGWLLAASLGQEAAAGRALVLAAALSAAAVAALALARHAGEAVTAGLMIVALAALDLTLHNSGMRLNGESPRAYRALEGSGDRTANFLKGLLARESAPDRRDRVEVLGLGGPWQNAPMAQGIEATLGYNPLQLADYARTAGVGRVTPAGQNAHEPERSFTPLFPSYRSTLADLLGLRYIAVGKRIEEIDPHLGPTDLPLVGRLGNTWIYENPGAFPRVFLAESHQRADFDQITRTGLWPGVDLRRTVLLEQSPTLPRPSISSASFAPSTRILSYRNTEVTVEVRTPRSGFLVLNDIYHAWWRAEIDDRPAPVLRANVIFRAVAVPAGRHVVRFRFEPLRGLASELWQRLSGRQAPPAPLY